MDFDVYSMYLTVYLHFKYVYQILISNYIMLLKYSFYLYKCIICINYKHIMHSYKNQICNHSPGLQFYELLADKNEYQYL